MISLDLNYIKMIFYNYYFYTESSKAQITEIASAAALLERISIVTRVERRLFLIYSYV
jgi:hypothetical protein